MRGSTAARWTGSRRLVSLGGSAVAIAGVVAVSGCGTGQIAQTADQRPTIVGVNAQAGSVALRNVMVEFPPDNDRYEAGGNAVLDVTLINSGTAGDSLIGATSTAASRVALTADAAPTTTARPAPSTSGSVSPSSSSSAASPSSTPSPSSAASGSPSPSSSAPSSVTLPVDTLVSLNGAGEHLELEKLNSSLVSGASVSVTFRFATAGSVTVDVPVATTPTNQPRPSFSPSEGSE